MMGKTRYKRLRETLDRLKAEKGEDVSNEDLNLALIQDIGSLPSTLKATMFMIRELKMIEEVNGRNIIR